MNFPFTLGEVALFWLIVAVVGLFMLYKKGKLTGLFHNQTAPAPDDVSAAALAAFNAGQKKGTK